MWGSLVTTIPPSPTAPRFLAGYKLKAAAPPKLPARRPPHIAPCAWQASSRTGTPCAPAKSTISLIDAIRPNMCTGMMARVRSVIAAATASRSILPSRAPSVVTRPDIEGAERELQGRESGIDADRVANATIAREVLLERLDLLPQHEVA